MIKSKSKPRKIFRDTIQGITKPAIKRLAYTAGATAISGLIYEEIRGVLKRKMEKVIGKAVYYSEYYRLKTVNEYAIAASIHPKMWSKDPKAESCDKKRPKSKSRSRKKNNITYGQIVLSNIKLRY